MKAGTFISKNLIKPHLLFLLLSVVGMMRTQAQTYSYDPPLRTYTDCGSGTEQFGKLNYSSCSNGSGLDTYQLGQVHCALWSYNSGTITIRVQKCSGYFKNGNSGKVIIRTSESVVHCSSFTITDNYTDYVTATWNYGSLQSQELFQVYLITSDLTYKFYAGLITITPSYTISASASPSSGGSVSGGGNYTYYSYCYLSASANSGYSFVRWKKGSSTVSTSPNYSFRVTADASYVAEFEANTYTISASASPSNGGSVSGAGTYNQGSTCTLSAYPNSGYSFVRWTKNGSQVSTSSTYSFTVNGDASYVAVFQQNSYTISASASPSNGGSVSGAGNYNQGSTCTLTASPATGYSFVRWTKNGSQVSTSASYSFTVTESASYVAVFQQNSYTVTASASPSNGGSVSGGGSFNYGSTCTLTASPNTGYAFVRWTKNGSQVSTSASYSFTVTESASYVAVFQQNSYAISASASPSNGGSVSGGGSFNYGSTCTLTASPNTGYSFVRWTKNGSQVSTSASYSFTVTESASYVAVFQQNSYTIATSASPSEGGSVSGDGFFNYGSTCTITATPNTGYSFVRWTKNGSQVSTNASHSFTVTESASYVAVFSLNSYAISVSASPSAGGSVSGAGTFNHGSTCSLTATANPGYVFTNWTENGTVVSSSANYSFTVTGARTLVGNFEIEAPATHFIPQSEGFEDNMTLTGVIQIGGVEMMTTSLELGAFCNGQCRGAVRPVFFPTTQRYLVMITIFGENGDPITFKLYDHDQNIELDLVSPEGVVFGSNSYGSLQNPYVLNFTLPIVEYTVTATANPSAGGTVSGAGTYQEGQSCTLTATPNTGYSFVRWTKNGNQVSTNPSYTFTVTANASFVAVFSKNSYNITASASPSAGGTVSGAGSYNHGSTCSLTATANPGYAFTNWTENGTVVSTSANYSFTVTGARTLVANFEIEAPDNHYIPQSEGFEDNMTLTGVIQIDGVEQMTTSLELGAFCNGQCRGAVRPVFFPTTQRYLVMITIFGENGDPITFKLYDHDQNSELDLVSPEGVVFGSNSYGSLQNPYVLNFTLPAAEYTITATANPSAGGTVSGAGTYQQGQSCTLTATPKAGYNFVKWTKNGTQVSTNPSYTFTVTANASYVAVFSKNSYNITASASPSAGGTVSGAGSYNHGATCTLTATANTGYAFTNWTENGSAVSTSATYSFTVTGARTLVANFEVVQGNEDHWIPQSEGYEDNMTLTGVIQIDGVEQMTTSLELGAFCNGECRGTVRPVFFPMTQRYLAMITIFGVNGDELTFKLYDHDQNEELDLVSPEGVVFGTNSYGSIMSPYVLNFTSSVFSYYWTPVHYASDAPMTMTMIGMVRIDFEEQAVNNLEVGAFSNDVCRGRSMLEYDEGMDRYLVFLTLWGNNGNALTFRLYDHTTGTELDLICATELTYTDNAHQGSLTEPYPIDFVTDVSVPTTFTRTLDAGWNWFSCNIEFDANKLEELKTEIASVCSTAMIKTQNNGFINYVSGRWSGSITQLGNEMMLLICVDQEVDLQVEGMTANPLLHSVMLNPGWNWIGYVEQGMLSLSAAFANFTPENGDMVKCMNSFSIYNATSGTWSGNLKNLEPGNGYVYLSNRSGSIEFMYPTSGKGK